MEKFFDGILSKPSEREEEIGLEPDPPISEEVMMSLQEANKPYVADLAEHHSSQPLRIIPQQKKKAPLVWDKISRVCMYLLFGLMPFWFLPFSAYPVDDAKNLLIGLATLLAGASWLVKVLLVGKLEIPKLQLWMLALLFLAGAAISTALSLSPSVSIWGANFQPDTLFPLLFAFLGLFVTSVVFTNTDYVKKALLFVAGSAVLVAILSLFQFFAKYIFPFDFTKIQSFNVFGSLESTGVFLGLGLLVTIAMTLGSTGIVKRAVFILGALLIGASLLLLNASYIWLGLTIGFALALSWQIVGNFMEQRGSEETGIQGRARSRVSLFTGLTLVCGILFFIGLPVSQIVSLPPSVSPSFWTTLGIGKDMLGDGVGRAIFGSGPGTFLYEYLIHRPDAVNGTSFFAVRFLQGFSFISTLFVSLGLFGIVSFLGFLGSFVWLAFRGVFRLTKNFNPLEENLISSVGFIFLIFIWFFYPISTPLLVLTFLFGGLLVASLRNQGAIPQVRIVFAQSVQAVFLFSFGAIILLTGIMISAYWQAQHYAAAVIAAQGVNEYNTTNGSAIDDATSKLGLAISLDSSNDLYFRTLSQLFTVRAANVLKKSSGTEDASTLQQNFQQEFQSAIQAAKFATTVNDPDPLNWQALGDVYASFFSVVNGSDAFAIQGYQEMTKRDPKDPFTYLIFAQAYVNASDVIQAKISNASSSQADQSQVKQLKSQSDDYLAKAQDALKQSLVLKSDYAPALYLAAQVYDRQGNRAQAIASAQLARSSSPQDVGINYELGILYYLNNQFDAARIPLEQAVAFNPNYSNARYLLGLVYSKQNQTQKAIDQFQEIQKLNPDNTQVKQIIANLQAGKDALDGLTGSQQQTQAPVPQTGGAVAPTPLKK